MEGESKEQSEVKNDFWEQSMHKIRSPIWHKGLNSALSPTNTPPLHLCTTRYLGTKGGGGVDGKGT